MEEDDLLTPYKEESFETYGQRTLESSSCESELSSVEFITDDDDSSLRQIEFAAPINTPDGNDPEMLSMRKRGRPKKPKPPTPDPSEDPGTPTPKRRRGRPRRGEETPRSHQVLLQTMNCIIPDGMKRQSRPSTLLADYESFSAKGLKDDFGDEDATFNDSGEKIKRGRGRPRTRPEKVRVLLPDGTPRGRGRPRLKPLIIKNENGEVVSCLNETANQVNENGDILPSSNEVQDGDVKIEGMVSIPTKILNGGIRIKRKRGRPRKYPFIEKINKFPKRVAKPGKKLGRPKKNRENETPKESLENKKSEPTWKIKWNGIFKYVKSPISKSDGTKMNGLDKKMKNNQSGGCEENKENMKKLVEGNSHADTLDKKVDSKSANCELREESDSRSEKHEVNSNVVSINSLENTVNEEPEKKFNEDEISKKCSESLEGTHDTPITQDGVGEVESQPKTSESVEQLTIDASVDNNPPGARVESYKESKSGERMPVVEGEKQVICDNKANLNTEDPSLVENEPNSNSASIIENEEENSEKRNKTCLVEALESRTDEQSMNLNTKINDSDSILTIDGSSDDDLFAELEMTLNSEDSNEVTSLSIQNSCKILSKKSTNSSDIPEPRDV